MRVSRGVSKQKGLLEGWSTRVASTKPTNIDSQQDPSGEDDKAPNTSAQKAAWTSSTVKVTPIHDLSASQDAPPLSGPRLSENSTRDDPRERHLERDLHTFLPVTPPLARHGWVWELFPDFGYITTTA
jgi:hypothetical protein